MTQSNQRAVNVIRTAIEQETENGARTRLTPGVIDAASGYTCSAYVGDDNLVEDISVPAGMLVSPGDYAVVGQLDSTAWIDRLLPRDTYAKLIIDPNRALIGIGNGLTNSYNMGERGQSLRSGGENASAYWSDSDAAILPPKVNVFTTLGDTTWVKPASVHHVVIEVQGAGGGGGGAALTSSNQASAGSGGGGGGYAKRTLDGDELAGDTTYNVLVGTGGSGGSGSLAGSNGEQSSFTGTGITPIIGTGGSGGAGGVAGTTMSSVDGGAGGSASGGDFHVDGATGAVGSRLSLPGASSASPLPFAHGGDTMMSPITSAPPPNQNGRDGKRYGAGGSGASNEQNNASRTGGKGSDGVVIVTEYFTGSIARENIAYTSNKSRVVTSGVKSGEAYGATSTSHASSISAFGTYSEEDAGSARASHIPSVSASGGRGVTGTTSTSALSGSGASGITEAVEQLVFQSNVFQNNVFQLGGGLQSTPGQAAISHTSATSASGTVPSAANSFMFTWPSSGQIQYNGGSNIVIDGKTINGGTVNSPSGIGITIRDATNITIRNVDMQNLIGGIYLYNCSGTLLIENLRIRNIGNVSIDNKDIGAGHGNHIQFAECQFQGEVRNCKFLGGRTEDMISIWHSGGYGSGQEMVIHNNQFQGMTSDTATVRAWASNSGTGIILSDGGGNAKNGNVIFRDNTLLNAGQVVIQFIDGPNLHAYNNVMLSEPESQHLNNQPMGSWEGYPVGSCHDNTYYMTRFNPNVGDSGVVYPTGYWPNGNVNVYNNTQNSGLSANDYVIDIDTL